MPVVIETVEDFIQKHGNDAINIDKGATLLFSDGASMDAISGSWRREPPRNPNQSLKLQQLYWQTKVDRAEHTFHSFQAALHEQAQSAMKYSNLRPPQPADVENLKRLRDQVKEHRQQLARINDEIAESKRGQEERLHEAIAAERVRELQRVSADINSITLDD